MHRPKNPAPKAAKTSAAKLWLAADKLRSNVCAAEYTPVVIGLMFLKYISEACEEIHARLVRFRITTHELAPLTLLK